ncbi:MAG: site-specific integrase [Aestuariivirga sp.]|uniref:site-specific integrase n=1 Tax=Aestuariivirga sp. TaxID=2650926 RepID=UPI0025BFE0FA|nr:site-specific integrase [Aestuariivirga sp.]MCA3562346.1 site-specific integrase [Aestuariivirga sp.]
MARLTDTRATRLRTPEKGQAFEWCSEVRGFGVRLTPGAKSYIVQFRAGGRSQRMTLGRVGVLPFEGPPDRPGARDLAIAALNAARRGEDPSQAVGRARHGDGVTMNAVWDEYKKAGFPKLRGVGRKRDSTIARDEARYDLLIRPSIGKERVEKIDTARVRRWLDDIPTEGQRSHALVMLKSLLNFAGTRGFSKIQPIDVKPTKSREVQNFYRPEEIALLDRALVDLIAEKPSQRLAFSALRLLIATGARLGEITSLRWAAVDLERRVVQLERDKTSDNRRDILLTAEAVTVLKALPRTASPFVFFSDSAAGHIMDLKKAWLSALSRAKLRRLRLHDLRHSFASAAIRQGVSLYVVGKLLGHRQATTTQRYAHLEQEVARDALDKIAKATGGGNA